MLLTNLDGSERMNNLELSPKSKQLQPKTFGFNTLFNGIDNWSENSGGIDHEFVIFQHC